MIEGKKSRRGFVFTLSIVLLSITLIAMASYFHEWRRSDEVLPSDAVMLQGMVAADLSVLTGANATVDHNPDMPIADQIFATASVNLPLKREGQPVFDPAGYAKGLANSMRDTNLEVIFDGDGMEGTDAAIMLIQGTGTDAGGNEISSAGFLELSNDGADDTVSFHHPQGQVPLPIITTITCSKPNATVGRLISTDTSFGDIAYIVIYTDTPGNATTIANNVSTRTGNVSMNITFPDGTIIRFFSTFSPSGLNRTSVSYTKSPGALLVLPFDSNVSSGSARDYSEFARTATLGAGTAAPAWVKSCRLGGCYSFDGTDDYMAVSNFTSCASEDCNFTLSLWVKAGKNTDTTLLHQMADDGAGHQQGMKWYLDASNNLYIAMNSFGDPPFVSPAIDLSDREWHMVTLTRGGTVPSPRNVSIYLDGIPVYSTSPATVQGTNTTTPLLIGTNDTGANYTGMLDEMRAYNRTLSAEEVQGMYEGTYQSPCNVLFSSIYIDSNFAAQKLSSYYNARLRIRSAFPGCILAMPFDSDSEENATGAVLDYSRFLMHGTRQGAAWTRYGAAGGAYVFGATDDRITVPSPVLSGTGDFTISAWVNPDSISDTQVIAGNYDPVQNTGGFRFALDSSGRPALLISSSVEANASVGAAGSPTGDFVHVAAERKEGVVTFYINGAAAGSYPLSNSIANSADMAIGNGPSYTTERFKGTIDELRIYGRALGAEKIAALYADSGLMLDKAPATSDT